MDYLQAAVKIAREQVGADTTTAQEATTAAAASASAAAASALTAVEVVAEVDMDGKPPTMKEDAKEDAKLKINAYQPNSVFSGIYTN